jgi:hypothetical protein
MTDRTWIGGGNNRADNPNDWSPYGVPQPTDSTVFVNQGTMNVNNFKVDFEVLGDATINLKDGSGGSTVFGHAVFNMKGDDNFGIQPIGNASATVNLAANSHWIGTFSDFGGALIVNGVNKSSIVNDSSGGGLNGAGSFAFLNADVEGTGQLVAFGGSKLEFGQTVGSGQVIAVDGRGTGVPGSVSVIQIDKPNLFAGQVNLGFHLGGVDGGEEIDLIGLAQADSYTYQNDLLSIFGGGKVIDTLRLIDNTTNGFAVEKTASGVIKIATITDPTNPPVGLPIDV